MSDLVRYSKIVKKGNMRFMMKKYNDSDNTVLYDLDTSAVIVNSLLNLKKIKNLVIDTVNHGDIYINDILAENIYFLDSENLGGMTIPYNRLIENSRGYYFCWSQYEQSNINKINIIGNVIKSIDVKNLESVRISMLAKNVFSIEVEDEKSIIEYIIDELGNINTIKKSYYITKSDIVNNEINLNDYVDYEEIIVDVDNKIKIDNLIINEECLKHINKLYDALSYIHYKKLIINSNNKMKLFPNILELEHSSFKDICVYQTPDNLFYILYKNEKIIYFDNNELKIIDKEKNLNEDKNILSMDFYLEDKFHQGKHSPILIIKYKNNKNKIKCFDESVEINKMFNWFNINKLYEYYHHDREEIKTLLENNDWYTMFDKRYIDFYKLKTIRDDYLKFINDMNRLKELGFTKEAIKYLYDNNFNNITNFRKENGFKYENNYIASSMSKEEIDKFNELGSIYIKKKTLSK